MPPWPADLKRHAEDIGRPLMFEVFARYDLIDDTEARPTYAASPLRVRSTTDKRVTENPVINQESTVKS